MLIPDNIVTQKIRKEDLVTKRGPYTQDYACPIPRFERFLDLITCGRKDLAYFLQRCAGYWGQGTTTEQKIFFLLGNGGNGKSSYLSIISKVLGKYHCHTEIDTWVVQKFPQHSVELARLVGVRMVTSGEPQAGQRWNEARLKAFTGGDPITASYKHQNPFTFVPKAKLVFNGNRLPDFDVMDEGIKRRFLVIPFDAKVPGHEVKSVLEAIDQEGPGITAWLLVGWSQWMKIGLRPPECVVNASRFYVENEDVLGYFLDEACDLSDITAFTSNTHFHAVYQDWCEKRGERVLAMRVLGKELRARGIDAGQRDASGNIRGIKGLRIKSVF